MNPQIPVCTVSQLNQHIKTLMDGDGLLSGVFVKGELSNYKVYPSGHHYFSMKDEGGSIRCVLFRREAARLRFQPKNGMQAVALGRVSVYPRDGQYQLYCDALQPEGMGELHLAFEQLKEQLWKEGLFDPAHKKPLPAMPETVALITSAAGAAVRDMLRILKARWPLAKVVLLPVRVQGDQAAAELAGAVRYADRCRVADVIIIGRGGGSMEDLWAFNDPGLARAIYDCETPVISAVGHEPDVTISDFVADVRAATPSNGAELAVPDKTKVQAELGHLMARLEGDVQRRLRAARERLERYEKSPALGDKTGYIRDKRLLLDHQQSRLIQGMKMRLSEKQKDFTAIAASLDALSPLKVLARGYAVASDEQGRVVRSAAALAPRQEISLRLKDGRAACAVLNVEPDGPEKENDNAEEKTEL